MAQSKPSCFSPVFTSWLLLSLGLAQQPPAAEDVTVFTSTFPGQTGKTSLNDYHSDSRFIHLHCWQEDLTGPATWTGRFLLSIAKHPHTSWKWQSACSDREMVSSYKFHITKIQRFTSIKGNLFQPVQWGHPTGTWLLVVGWLRGEGWMPPSMSHASSIWQNVYLCLGPSLSLSVDVLIVGLSSVLCGGQKGSVTFWQRRVCLCMNSHNRDVCRPSLWWATCGMPDMREWASGPWGEMQAVCMLLLCPLQRDGPAHHCPLEPRCHSDFLFFKAKFQTHKAFC